MHTCKKIVVGVDLSADDRLVSSTAPAEPGRIALQKAVWLAQNLGASLHLLASLDVEAHAEAMMRRDQCRGGGVCVLAEKRLDELAQPARDAGVNVTCEVAFGSPLKVLLDDVQKNGRDLVVVGTRARGAVARNLLGSTALGLLRHAPVAVWVARKGPDDEFDHVLAPVAFGELTHEVLESAAWVAGKLSSHVHALHVVDYSGEHVLRMGGADAEVIDEYRRERRAAVEQNFAELEGTTGLDAVSHTIHIGEGNPADEILRLSEEHGADLVVLGALTHGALSGILLGSTAESVMQELDTSLLVVKVPSERS